jgi:hypothetical protein
VQAESTRRRDLLARGRMLDTQLALLADLALGDKEPRDMLGATEICVRASLQPRTPPRPALASVLEQPGSGQAQETFRRLLDGFNVWLVVDKGKTVAMIYVRADGSFVGFQGDLSSVDGPIRAIEGVSAASMEGESTASSQSTDPA